MLSSSVIKNVGQASHYYSQQDNYYTREEGIEQSEWWGKGAENLSLTGQVDMHAFNDLLLGRLPHGEKLGKVVDGQIKHRPGWDLTFSAPKSVSLLALIGGDTRLVEAHRRAVIVALSHVERSCTEARIQTPDGMDYQLTKNVVAALFHHDLSRAKDPQLHTHSVMMNMTERQDGKWRSLASKLGGYGEKNQHEIHGFIERVRHHNRYFSKLYETELAYQVKELGYEITTDTPSGIFEIAGVSKEVLQCFSKRRTQIEEKLAEKGLSGGKAAAYATLDTRSNKENVDRVSLKEQWVQDAKAIGLDCQTMIERTQSMKPEKTMVRDTMDPQSLDAIREAAKVLSVFQSTFTLEDLVTTASEYAIRHHLPASSLLTAADAQLVSGDLLSIPNESGKTVFMAKHTLDEEKHLFTQLENPHLAKATIDASKLKDHMVRDKTIHQTHDADLETVFGRDRIVLIEGNAARDALVEPIFNTAKSARLNVALISPSLVGSKQLAKQVNQKEHSFWEQLKALFTDGKANHYSVMQFLSEINDGKFTKQALPNVLMVDHAHLLSTHQQARLFEWSKTHQTKIILFGNKSTLLSQQRGISLNQLIERGMPTISMLSKENLLMQSVDENNLQGVIQKMAGKIMEVHHSEDRHHAMANHLSLLHEKDRKQSWLIAHQKQTVSELNRLTHHALLTQGKLGKTTTTNVLIPHFLPEGKGMLAASYQKGDMVRFNESYTSLGVKYGDYLRVISHSKPSNRVILEHDNGKRVIWRPDNIAGKTPGKVERFREEQREFAVHETLVMHRSLKSEGMVKGERWTIASIRGEKIKLKNNDGNTAMLDLSKPSHRHMDYGYATTPHAIVHEKPAVLIADLPTRAFHTDQRQFYQAVSQPKEAWVYTDHAEGFISHLEKKTGDKLTAHATLSQSEELKKNLHTLYDILEKQMMDQKGTNSSKAAVDAMEYAIHHLSEREAGFTHKQLMQTAMQHALGDVTSESLHQAVASIEKAGILFQGQKSDGTLWTTMDAVKTEREIVALCQQDKGKFAPIASDGLVEKLSAENQLKPEQMAAVKAITQSRDRVMAVQGHPGTGKTTMLVTVADVLAAKNMMASEGYELIGLAPTHAAVKELTARGIPAQTLDSFLIASQRELDGKKHDKQILVIDEASMISNRKMLKVLRIVHEHNYRGVIPTGDTRQLPSTDSGKPFELVQTQVTTSSLVDIRRQSDHAPLLKKAVKETMAYDFKAAFQALKDSIIEVPMSSQDTKLSPHEKRMTNRMERVSLLVKDYFSFAKEERGNIQVITPGHDDRALANQLIRERLKTEGTLSKDKDHSLPILTSKNLTQAERSHTANFAVGDVLRFGKRESSHVKAGEYFSIVGMSKNHKLLTLKNEVCSKITWQVPTFDKKRLSSVEVFQKTMRGLQVGDVIRWSRSDKKHDLLSNETARVIALEKDKVTVELENKQRFTFNPNHPQFQHWEHGYAATVYAVQGKTKEIILAHLESFRANLTSQPSFLVALTRAVNVFRLYTDNIEKLLQTIERNTGVKLSSLEVIGEFPGKMNDTKKPSAHEVTPTSSTSIQPEKLAQFSRQLIKDNHQTHKAEIKAYQRIQEGSKSISSDKTPAKIQQIEREI